MKSYPEFASLIFFEINLKPDATSVERDNFVRNFIEVLCTVKFVDALLNLFE